jgi:hypothetical protein
LVSWLFLPGDDFVTAFRNHEFICGILPRTVAVLRGFWEVWDPDSNATPAIRPVNRRRKVFICVTDFGDMPSRSYRNKTGATAAEFSTESAQAQIVLWKK